MEAQREISKAQLLALNSSRRAIGDFSQGLTPRSSRNSRPGLYEGVGIAPAHSAGGQGNPGRERGVVEVKDARRRSKPWCAYALRQ